MVSLTPQQKQALNSQATIWVTASAGSGKTKVLTDRLMTLLIAGAAPERLLCLTFTKAAAAEMANRLQAALSRWFLASDDVLSQALSTLGFEGTNAQIKRARALFTELLDTPGGFKIQTLHGFCQSLLGRFPLEAGVAPHFSILEERDAERLLQQAQDDVFRQVSEEQYSLQAQSLKHLASVFSEVTLRSLLTECVREWGRQGKTEHEEETTPHGLTKFQNIKESDIPVMARRDEVPKKQSSQDGSPCPLRWLAMTTEMQDTETGDQETTLNSVERQRVIKILEAGEASDREKAYVLKRHLENSDARAQEAYVTLFLTQKGEPRARLISSRLASLQPWVEEALRREQEHICRQRDASLRQDVLRNSQALQNLSLMIHSRYQALKKQKDVLDYDDLITCTQHLLRSSQGALWVLYKLDSGLDHILIDEAQDTNPEQWHVIRGLADAFFETEEKSKTLFIVGDPKQSIYSFQGASPLAFSAMQQHTQQRLHLLKRPFQEINLNKSFRSSPAVLQVVDWVFEEGDFLKGVSPSALQHEAFYEGLPGCVEIWPLLEWDSEKFLGASPETLLAQGIAHQIQTWLREGLCLNHGLLRPQDIMILVRRRGTLMRALVKALKDLEIPVAGVDRIVLQESLGVADLLKLAEFCLLPRDDLTLATVLKGPLLRLSEEKLFELAYQRGHASLWHRLKVYAQQENPPFLPYDSYSTAYGLLKRLLDSAQSLSPFAFFAMILIQEEGKQKIIERLGFDVADALDEFLALCLAYEKSHPASLQGFVAWMAQYTVEIKRNLEMVQRDEVRILTIHGAKGLEAPLVILPDTVHPPTEVSSVSWISRDNESFPLLMPSEIHTPESLKTLRRQTFGAQEEEYHRLLYVALTRAKEHLYICGWKKERSLSEKSWYAALSHALKSKAGVTGFSFQSCFPEWGGEGLRFERGEGPQGSQASLQHTLCLEGSLSPLPDWVLKRPVFEEKQPEKTVTRSFPLQEGGVVRTRGVLLHFFLEKLVAVSQAVQESRGYFLSQSLMVDPLLVEDCLNEALQLLRQPDLQWLWDSEGLSEVTVTGEKEGERIVGRLDRLLITPQKVYVIDFKTDRKPSPMLPFSYVQQLELYRDLLTPLYTQPILCGVLWTVTGELMWV